MRILGIETSCDETAAAIVEGGRDILSNVVASQIEIHARYGGVVPEVASRQHLLQIIPVVKKALNDAGMVLGDLDAVAVTAGPGLAGSLLVGLNVAKAIAAANSLPLVGVNHLEGHIYANWLLWEEGAQEVPPLPLVCLIASGGHTDLVFMKGHGEYIALGRTLDDAAGEAFDKVARVLGLGFPGGPAIQKSSLEGHPSYPLPRAWLRDTDDFSFSGLKTAVLHLARRLGVEGGGNGRPQAHVADVAASFQEAVVDVLVNKTLEAAQRHRGECILLGGGVAANALLRKRFLERSSIPVRWPPPSLCTDNAAMIASCGYFLMEKGKVAGWNLDVTPTSKVWQ